MIIYTSEKVAPYVYMGIHKETGEFYIGSRYSSKRTLPSHLDLFVYRTSSRYVKPVFDQFNWFIVAEFFSAAGAVMQEQQMIHEHWGNPKLLNRSCMHNNAALFSSLSWGEGAKRTAEKRRGKPGKPHTLESRQKISVANKGRKIGPPTEEHRLKLAAAKKGKPHDPLHVQHMSKTWLLVSPEGMQMTITNLAKFCRERRLTASSLHLVADGKREHYRGWKCSRIADTGSLP